MKYKNLVLKWIVRIAIFSIFLFQLNKFPNLLYNLFFSIFFIYTLYLIIEKRFIFRELRKFQKFIYIVVSIALLAIIVLFLQASAISSSYPYLIIWTKYTFVICILLQYKDKINSIFKSPIFFKLILNICLITLLIILLLIFTPLFLLAGVILEILYRV